MDVENKIEIDEFLNNAAKLGHSCRGIKGQAPKGMAYSDGSPVKGKVNVGWEDTVTGEICVINYSWEERDDRFGKWFKENVFGFSQDRENDWPKYKKGWDAAWGNTNS